MTDVLLIVYLVALAAVSGLGYLTLLRRPTRKHARLRRTPEGSRRGGARTEFADVEDVPVAYVPGVSCTAWDTPSGRPFPPSSLFNNGARISEGEFAARLPPKTPRR